MNDSNQPANGSPAIDCGYVQTAHRRVEEMRTSNPHSLEPPTVLDHTDPKQSHLDGLCFTRAWCFQRLGESAAAERLIAAALPHVAGGDYAGEHWLASFAMLALSAAALRTP